MSELDWIILGGGQHEISTDLYVSPTHSMYISLSSNYKIFIYNGKTDIVDTDVTSYIYENMSMPFTLLLVRMQQTDAFDNCYEASIGTHYARIHRVQNGTWTLLAESSKPVADNNWVHWKFRVTGNTLELYRESDGSWQKILQVDDDTFTSGAAGFGGRCDDSGRHVYFDDVQISEQV